MASRLQRQNSAGLKAPSHLLKSLSPSEFRQAADAFTKVSGGEQDATIDHAQTKDFLLLLGENIAEKHVEEIIEQMDANKDGLISFEEALSGLVSLRSGKLVRGSAQATVPRPGVPATQVTIKSESGATHAYSEEERTAFAEHINRTLASDERLKDRLPMDVNSDALFRAVHDGLLLCKMINKAVPDTVDERALNKSATLNVYQMGENNTLAINSAKAIGCKVVNIHVEDLVEGREHLVLGLIWQIVKIQLTSQINLLQHPELVRLLEPGEELSELLKLPPDQLLLRWLNFHLKQAGDERRVKNFGSDLQDSHVYTVVLNQISPTQCDLLALKEDDPMKRAAMAIENAKRLGVESFILPTNIVQGNARLNLAFCAQIFNTNPGLTITEEELVDMAGMLNDDVGDSREERAFRLWINSLGVEDLYIHSLFEDLRDGVVLLQVMDHVEPGSVSWPKVNRPPRNKFKRVENANYVVVIGKSQTFKFSLVGIGGVDVVAGNKKLILSIVWQLVRHHSLKVLQSLSDDGSQATDRDIIDWANARVERTGKPSRMESFRDSSLGSCTFFFHLLNALAPGILNPEFVTAGETAEEKEANAKYVISVARKLGALVFLTWEDLVEVKPKMILMFTASLMAWDRSAPGKAL